MASWLQTARSRLSAASSYSTDPHILFPAQMYDAASAVRWLRFNASVGYRLDGSRFVAAGFSAGGHLASMLGLAHGSTSIPPQAITAANNHGTPSAAWVHSLNDANAAASTVQGVITISGLTSLTTLLEDRPSPSAPPVAAAAASAGRCNEPSPMSGFESTLA